MSSELGNFLKYKRGNKSLRDFANYLEISHAYLDSIEKGIDPKTKKEINISTDLLQRLSKKLDVSVNAILDMISGIDYETAIKNNDSYIQSPPYSNYEPSEEEIKIITQQFYDEEEKQIALEKGIKYNNNFNILINTVKIPVYKSIKAGIPLESQSDIVEYMDIPKEWTKGNKKLFAIQLSGDSMYPKYNDHEIVIFEQNYDLEYCKNKDCAVMINHTESTFKKLLINEQGIVLQPYNIAYDIIMFSNEQIKKLPITILGVAIKKVSDIKYE